MSSATDGHCLRPAELAGAGAESVDHFGEPSIKVLEKYGGAGILRILELRYMCFFRSNFLLNYETCAIHPKLISCHISWHRCLPVACFLGCRGGGQSHRQFPKHVVGAPRAGGSFQSVITG